MAGCPICDSPLFPLTEIDRVTCSDPDCPNSNVAFRPEEANP